MIESVKESKKRKRNERSDVLKQKKLHGQFLTKLKKLQGKKKRHRSIKRGTESIIISAQEQVIRTNQNLPSYILQ